MIGLPMIAGSRTVAALPQAVRQHHHRFEARRRGLLRQELTAHDRLDAEQAETDRASPIRRGRAPRSASSPLKTKLRNK